MDIRLREELPASVLTKFEAPKGFPVRKPMKHGQFQLQAEADKPFAAKVLTEEAFGMRYEREDGSEVVQLRRNGLTHSILRGWHSTGVSDVAGQVSLTFEESVRHYLEPRLKLLLPEIENLLVVSDATSTPVDLDTVDAATRFAYTLPRFGPLPEVSADPDGEISFDWAGPSGEMFSVSVSKQNRLAYAGWFGEGSRVHGIEQLGDGCPQQVVRGIAKTIR